MSANQIGIIRKGSRYEVNPPGPAAREIIPFENGEPVMQNSPVALAPSSPQVPRPVAQELDESKIVLLSARDEIAHYRLIFVKRLQEEISKEEKPTLATIKDFLALYNAGHLLSTVLEKLGPISLPTAYRFRKALDEGGVEGLIPEYGKKGVLKITEHEKNFLLTLLLHPNRLKVAYAITLTKNYLKKQEIESPSSERTLRRFADQFKKEHYDIWVLHREGEKALDDKVLPYIERDRNLIAVGEGLVADGHRLNFQVVNPFTGKPCRAAMVLFWDWRSSYPLGWEIMLEENIQCISTAFRNAVLTLGKFPKWILMDNGKAFKAKIFTSGINLTETEILGMFARLNVNVHFAWPYNAKSKPIERFFGVFTDWFERLMPSFTGSSIEDKPAWTKRNEKLAQSLHDPRVPTISEVNDWMFEWREFYVDQESGGLGGQKPREVFESGRGSGVDPAELVHMMMPREFKNVGRNGIDFLGCYWFNEALYGLKDRVLIKYSLTDLSKIYCFHKDEFLCALTPRTKTHPMASESGTPKDMEDVKRMIAQKRGLKRQTVNLHKILGRKSESLPWKEIVQQVPDVIESIEKIEAEKITAKFISPFLDEPEKRSRDLIQENGEGTVKQEIGDNQAAPIIGEVNPRTGRTSPMLNERWEVYDWYMKREKAQLNAKDLIWIKQYEASEEWQKLYGYATQTEIVIDPRSGLSRPAGGRLFGGMWERYDWYREVEKKFPGTLNDKDWGHIRDFEATRSWTNIYSGSIDLPMRRMARSECDNQTERPQFEDDDDRYLWLMAQESLEQKDLEFIRKVRKTSAFYCENKYGDWEDLERKVRSGSKKDPQSDAEATENPSEE